jgi:hypothetical protein
VALGLPLAATLACLSAMAPVVVNLSGSGPRVVAAVQAGYPELCNEWRDKLVASPSPASWYTTWDVSCVSGYVQSTDLIMTVNVVTCQWREPFRWSADLVRLWASITTPSQRLRRCP